jgi:hypothetical protein
VQGVLLAAGGRVVNGPTNVWNKAWQVPILTEVSICRGRVEVWFSCEHLPSMLEALGSLSSTEKNLEMEMQ